MQRNERRRGITAVVRSKLFRESGRFPTLPEMAAELAVHPRTLRRQLVEEVSKRLGYTDTSTFSHAFKRWHGVPPSAYPRTG
jgi:AraC-like DNA-binding protein